jgi:hypothetical protein
MNATTNLNETSRVEVTGNFLPLLEEELARIHAELVRQAESAARRTRGAVDQPAPLNAREMRFDLSLYDLDPATERKVRVPLVNGAVPAGITVPIGSYVLNIVDVASDCDVTQDRRIHVAGEGPVDLSTLPDLDNVQVASLTAQLTVAEPVTPAVPALHRIPRQAADTTVSRLGLTIGDTSQDIKLVSHWCWHALYLPRPLMVGAIEGSVSMSDKDSFVEFRLFDFLGNPLIAADLKARNNGIVRAEFSHTRLKAGDTLIAWRSRANYGSGAQGSYPADCGIFGTDLPERPVLDALIARTRTGVDELELSITSMWRGEPVRIGMPSFKLLAE